MILNLDCVDSCGEFSFDSGYEEAGSFTSNENMLGKEEYLKNGFVLSLDFDADMNHQQIIFSRQDEKVIHINNNPYFIKLKFDKTNLFSLVVLDDNQKYLFEVCYSTNDFEMYIVKFDGNRDFGFMVEVNNFPNIFGLLKFVLMKNFVNNVLVH